MAEIKSTMELVLERASRIGRATEAELQEQEEYALGMRLAADYLKGDQSESLLDSLGRHSSGTGTTVRKGMIDSLLRNVFLPREEFQLSSVRVALDAILDMGGRAGEISSICRDIEAIVNQYGQHRGQVRQQLEAAVKQQIEQAVAMQEGLDTTGLNIDPTLQPQFQEEWSRLEGQLNEQYSQALDQHKDALKGRLRGG